MCMHMHACLCLSCVANLRPWTQPRPALRFGFFASIPATASTTHPPHPTPHTYRLLARAGGADTRVFLESLDRQGLRFPSMASLIEGTGSGPLRSGPLRSLVLCAAPFLSFPPLGLAWLGLVQFGSARIVWIGPLFPPFSCRSPSSLSSSSSSSFSSSLAATVL